MDVTAGMMAGANPFSVLTFIAAPALLTNASSLLLLGTSNRLARAVDRVRSLAHHLDTHTDTESPVAQQELRMMQTAERRVLIIVRAMTAFYLAVGSFAFGTMLALIGATLVSPDHQITLQWVTRATIIACVVGVSAIMWGSLSLVFESRITFQLLRAEADLSRERYAHRQVA